MRSGSGYDLRYQVKQYVGELEGERGRFRVFKTGLDSFYLLSQIDPHGCDTGLQFPVRKADLIEPARLALAHGYSFSLPAYRRLESLERGVVTDASPADV